MFGKSSHTFEINYIYQNDPRAETYDADVDSLSQGEAARHLIQLHNADAENSLVMPRPMPTRRSCWSRPKSWASPTSA